MNNRLAGFRPRIPGIARGCRAALFALTALIIIGLLALAPVLLGYHPFIVADSDNGAYPADALAYYRYGPAEEMEAGTPVAVSGGEGIAVRTVSGRDDAARALYSYGTEDSVPFEYAEGELLAFCIPFGGVVVRMLGKPAALGVLFAAVCVFAFGGFVLPKWGYTLKYGKGNKEVRW